MGQPAARVGDPTTHMMTPLAVGPGSTNVMIGKKPAWRAVGGAAGAAINQAKQASDQVIDGLVKATLAAPDPTSKATAATAEQTGKGTAATTMGAAMTAASKVPSTSVPPGFPDIHTCPMPSPLPPHGPGVVTQASTTVMVNGLPLCRQGDKVMEALGPPDPIAMGCPTVKVGG